MSQRDINETRCSYIFDLSVVLVFRSIGRNMGSSTLSAAGYPLKWEYYLDSTSRINIEFQLLLLLL
jgi:hypothetical protein